MRTLTLKKKEPIHTYANHIAFIPKKKIGLDAFYEKVELQRQSAFDEDNWQMFLDASTRELERIHSHLMTEDECNSRCFAGWPWKVK